MAEIVDIAEYRKLKLDKAVASWEEYMARAEKFHKEGKENFAGQMLDKAKAMRKVIDKLRPATPKPSNRPSRSMYDTSSVRFTYNGRSSADLGWPKTPPETT